MQQCDRVFYCGKVDAHLHKTSYNLVISIDGLPIFYDNVGRYDLDDPTDDGISIPF